MQNSVQQNNATESNNAAAKQGGQPNAVQNQLLNINKPNPYVIVETNEVEEDGSDPAGIKGPNNENSSKKEVKFSYPKSKIFVGGLDFKVTNDELKQHFN